MKRNNNRHKLLVTSLLVMGLLVVQQSFALTWNSNVAVSGAWNTGASWDAGTVPALTSGGTNDIANIVSGDSITRSGNLLIGGMAFWNHVYVKNGGVLHVTGQLRLQNNGRITVETGGKLIVDGLVKGAGTNTYTESGGYITVQSGATAVFNSDVNLGNGNTGDNEFSGDVTINGNVSLSGSTRFTVGATGDVDVNGTLTAITTGVVNLYGDLEVNNLRSIGSSSVNLYNGVTTVVNKLTILNTGKVRTDGGPGGTIGWSTYEINTLNSGAFLGCNNGTKYDNNGVTAWPPPPNNPFNLNTCGAGCYALDSGSIAADQTICNGGEVAALSNTLSASGGDGSTYDYQWQSSTTSAVAGFSDITDSTRNKYDHGTLTTTTWFRREVTSTVCGTKNTEAVKITVYDALQPGTIGSAQTINHGYAPAPLTNDAAASGGGGFTYQWQDSPDGSTWSNIGAATAATYSPGALNNDTWYRRAAISTAGCGTVYSADIKITVEVILSCAESPPDLTEIIAPSGGIGAFTYQWQSSTDNLVWTDIGGETGPTMSSLPAPSTTTWYRRGVFNNGCGPLYTPAIQAQVAQGPGGVPGDLLVWLKPENATTGTWTDASGKGNDYIGVGSPTKIANGDSTSNYNPYVRILDGGYDAPAGAELGDDYTIFIVASKLASDNDGRILDGHTGDYCWGDWGTFTQSLNTNGSPAKHNSGQAVAAGNGEKRMQTFVRSSGGTLEHRVNGVTAANYGASASASGIRVDINQGAFAGSQASDANVYEMLIFNDVLSTEEVERIESYLMSKFGMKDLASYLSSIGEVTYDISSHDNDVIALGKECYFSQKQSESVDDSIKAFIDVLAASNVANTGTITNDISYVILGHDGGRLKSTAAAEAEMPVTILKRLEREWKLTNTNFSDDFSLEIEVESFGPYPLDDLKLLVDADGDFSNATIYGVDEGLTFNYGSIIIGGIGTGIFGMGTTSFFTLGTESIALPVELVSFQAVKTIDAVEVSWYTTMQRYNDFFVVERSLNGVDGWREIARVQGENSSDELLAYSILDDEICSKCYYRLVQIDFDGKETWSDVVSVTNDVTYAIDFELYPNPANDQIVLEIVSTVESEYLMNVYSVDGINVHSIEGGLVYGDNSITIDLETFAPGLYFVEVTTLNGSGTSGAAFKKL